MGHPTSLIERWLAAGDCGDVDEFDDLAHPGARVHAPRGLSTESREAEMARVVVTGTLVGDFGGLPGSGKGFRMDQAVICHLRDGRIAEAWKIADVGSLADQVS